MEFNRWIWAMAVLLYVSGWCDGLSDLPEPLPGTNTYELRMPGANPQYVINSIFHNPTKRFLFSC